MNRKQEHGVALLFALGLLSLMSVLGVAFVTNSLTAQKTAANLGARNQAQILLDSAVNRIFISLMAVLRQDQMVSDLSVIYSTNDGNPRGTLSGTTVSSLDGLIDPETSMLNMFIPGQAKYDGSKSRATWTYIRNNDGQVVGRMAYQVLPTGLSGLSLDQVLKGVYNPKTGDLEATAANNFWNQRIGKNTSELNVGKASAFLNEWKYGTNAPYDTLPANKDTMIVYSFDEFFKTDIYKIIGNPADAAADNQRQVWLRRWFSESAGASPEVFYRAASDTTKMGDATAFHRFNLSTIDGGSATDKWYPRFAGNKNDNSFKNSEKAVKELLKDAKEFYPEDVAAPNDAGIPYLSKIGREKRSFSNLMLRRQQIAANLNDYCDEDSIPTSNKDPKIWSPENAPDFTGNEKTPYINEFAFNMQISPVITGGSWTGSALGSINTTLDCKKIAPKLQVELINIYDKITGDYKVKTWLKEFGFRQSASFTGTVTCTMLEGKEGGGSYDFTYIAKEEDVQTVRAVFNNDAAGLAVSDAVGAAKFVNGYAVAATDYSSLFTPAVSSNITLTAEPLKLKVQEAVESALSGKVNLADVASFNVELKTVTLMIDQADVTFTAAGLFDSSDSGVDFVRIREKFATSNKITIPLDYAAASGGLAISGGGAEDWKHFYISGMETRDPRQNLNFNLANTEGKVYAGADCSDWKSVPKLQNRADASSMDDPGKIGSLAVALNAGNVVFTGQVNSCSNPAAPFSTADLFRTPQDASDTGVGEGSVDYDRETVADPAWVGNESSTTHLSTAYIRNAPMESLWELGVIHRASAWETINIKYCAVTDGSSVRRAGLHDNNRAADLNAGGISYQDGDGILLDQVKLSSKVYTSGKLDVNMLLDNPATAEYNTAWNKDMVKALFAGIGYGQQIGDIYTYPDNLMTAPANQIAWGHANFGTGAGDGKVIDRIMNNKPAGRDAANPNSGRYVSRSDFMEGAGNPASGSSGYFLANGFGLFTLAEWEAKNDAQQEELVGKTINLLTAGATAPSTIQAVVLVQTIKPLNAPVDTVIFKEIRKKNNTRLTNADITPSGDGVDSSAAPAVKIESGNEKKFKAAYFTDSDGKVNYVHFDEITGELRALVTIKKINDSKGLRLILDKIQYY